MLQVPTIFSYQLGYYNTTTSCFEIFNADDEKTLDYAFVIKINDDQLIILKSFFEQIELLESFISTEVSGSHKTRTNSGPLYTQPSISAISNKQNSICISICTGAQQETDFGKYIIHNICK